MSVVLPKRVSARLDSLVETLSADVGIEFDATIRPSAHTAMAQEMLRSLPPLSIGEAAGASAAESSNGRAADYEIKALLGQGGMGAVHLAWQHSLGRHVAVKVLHPSHSKDSIGSLVREARVTGGLEHPSIVPIHAVGALDGERAAIVMKRIEGASWAEVLRDPKHKFIRDTEGNDDALLFHIEVLKKLCDGVSFAHGAGVLHCDLKPANVMLGAFGEVYLVDWGIACQVGAACREAMSGTPAYVAPEMLQPDAVLDERTDVYLLGAILHEVLTGQPRHHGSSLYQVLASSFHSRPFEYDDTVPSDLASLCNRATSREPSERPANAEAFRRQLVEFERHQASIALSHTATERLLELEALIDDDPDRSFSPEEVRAIYRVGTECRFGFRQALRSWPANPHAMGGEPQCITHLAMVELRQGHLDSARALVVELDDVPPALADLLDKAEAERDRDREERVRLEKLAHERDPSVGSGARRTLVIIVFIVANVISVLVQLKTDAGVLTPPHMIAAAVAFLVLVSGMLLVQSRILRTTFNRALAGVLVLALAFVLVSRILGYFQGLSTADILGRDLLICSAAAAVGSLNLFRWFALTALFALIGAFAVAVLPQYAVLIFSTTGSACLAVPLVVWVRKPVEPGGSE